MSGSMGGSSTGGSPRSGSSGTRAIASPFSQRATYADDDDDEPEIDPEDLWAPMGTPIPPATSRLLGASLCSMHGLRSDAAQVSPVQQHGPESTRLHARSGLVGQEDGGAGVRASTGALGGRQPGDAGNGAPQRSHAAISAPPAAFSSVLAAATS